MGFFKCQLLGSSAIYIAVVWVSYSLLSKCKSKDTVKISPCRFCSGKAAVDRKSPSDGNPPKILLPQEIQLIPGFFQKETDTTFQVKRLPKVISMWARQPPSN